MEVFRSFDFEMEDFVASIDEVDWYVPDHRFKSPEKRHWSEGLSRRFPSFRWNFAFKMPPLAKEYDLLYVQCMFIWDLQYISHIPDWRGKVKKSVIYITELFLSDIERKPEALEVLKRFDTILISYSKSVEALQKHTGVQTIFCTSGIDALKSAPGPNTFRRGVELHSLGRCNPVFFREFQKLVDHHDWAYLYNTVHLSTLDDYSANRKYLSDILKRTLFFEVNPAKFDGVVESKHQHEFGYRYFEGIAAGCILVGLENRNPNFKKVFPWEDVLIELPTKANEIVPFLLDLYARKDRLHQISRANTRGALLYHDFAYRWERTLKAVGLKPTGKLLQRKEVLLREAERYA